MSAPLLSDAIVYSSWLSEAMSSADHKVVLLDATSDFYQDGRKAYTKHHVPNAQFWDSSKVESVSYHNPRTFPTPDTFTDYARSHGVDGDSHVVVYDQDVQYNAARTWLCFRALGHQSVSVLDGGLQQWMNAGLPVSDEEPTLHKTGMFTATVQPHFTVKYEEVLDVIRNKSAQILDTRREEHYHGRAEEPSPSTLDGLKKNNFPIPHRMARGHMPGSLNVAMSTIYDVHTKLFKSTENIKIALTSAGVNFERPVIATCYSGIMACMFSVAAASLRMPDVAVYDGSWSEFGLRIIEDNIDLQPHTERYICKVTGTVGHGKTSLSTPPT